MDESKALALEEQVRKALGSPDEVDFDKWRKRHPDAIAYLNPVVTALYGRRRKQMQRIILFAATTAAAVCVLFGLSHLGTNGTESSAFAQAIGQIQKANAITWTTTVYERISSKDNQRHWYRANVRRFAYKAPGLYRETSFDEKGNVESVEITDALNKRVLTLYPTTKTATVAEVRPAYDVEGPFVDAKRMLNDYDLQFVEKRSTVHGDVNVFRHIEGKCFFDCWIDQKNKQLVEYRINQNADVTLADYENDPSRNANPEKQSSGGTIVGSITKEIDYNASLDESLFTLELPKDYAVKTQRRHLVSEQEMIDYFRLMVNFNGDVFPRDLSQPSSDQINKYRDMPKAERPPQAQELIEALDHYERIQLRGLPLREFLHEHADWNSFRYFGKGIKLGDKDRIICWYRLNDAKNADIYRVVYGDLSVKDVVAKDLPLPVGP